MNFFASLFDKFNLSNLTFLKIRLSDILDIIIVAVLIYIIMKWIRETRAWSLFKGILVVLFLNLLAYQLNLYTILWIIEKTLSVGILAIIVLFQPEFRKGLEQIGKGKLMPNFLHINNNKSDILSLNTITEVINACFKMGEQKIGALIILEQKVPIGDFEASGIQIDAIVSAPLLLNIFEKNTPLHDGAVLIRNNRIKSATCILPLTQKNLSQDLGTRHRAGVGASEVSDAYAFIVSEETGNVSIAYNGKLLKNLSQEKIKNMFTPTIKPSNLNIKKFFKREEK